MTVATQKVNLPCCNSATYLSLEQQTNYYFRTCANVLCGKKWDIQRRERGFFCTESVAPRRVPFSLTSVQKTV